MDFIKEVVRKVLKHHKETGNQGTLVIDKILEYSSDEDVVFSDSLTYLIGSFYNVTNVLAYCLYYLAKHGDLQEKLYTEITQVLGDNGLVEETNLKDLQFTNQVIDESLRFRGFDHAARAHDVDITLGGYMIPRNTPVIQALGVGMRDEKIWPAPAMFDPHRFDEKNLKVRHSYAFQPFGFSGKLVHPEMEVFLAAVLRSFKIELHDDQQVTFTHGISTHTAKEMWVKVIKR